MNRWQRKYRVIAADDFPEHSILLACAMRQTQALQLVHTLNRGANAMNYLLGHGRYADREKFPFPDVLVTEMGMPCLETVKLLSALGTGEFQPPFCVVLTNSPQPEHRREAERLGADAYFRKPECFHGLVSIAHEIERMVLRTEKQEAFLKLFGAKSA